MSEPLSSHENWTLDVEGKNNVFKGCAMIVFHQIMNQFFIGLFTFAFVSVGNSRRTDNRHIIAHSINKTDETVGVNIVYFTQGHFPFALIHSTGAFT